MAYTLPTCLLHIKCKAPAILTAAHFHTLIPPHSHPPTPTHIHTHFSEQIKNKKVLSCVQLIVYIHITGMKFQEINGYVYINAHKLNESLFLVFTY